MKTDVITDILCVFEGDELLIFRHEFHSVISILKESAIDYCLTGDIAISEYADPFATIELEIQLLQHSIDAVDKLINESGLKAVRQENSLKIISNESPERKHPYCIYLHNQVTFVTKNYKYGNSAVVFGIEDIPVLDISLLIWYQLFLMSNSQGTTYLRNNANLFKLLDSSEFDQRTVFKIVANYGQQSMVKQLTKAIEEMEEDKINPGLNWGELQEHKRRLNEHHLNTKKSNNRTSAYVGECSTISKDCIGQPK